MKESQDNVDDTIFDNAPIFLIKEGRNIVKHRRFVGPKLKHNSCQYHTIRDMYRTISIVSCIKNSVSYRRIVHAHESYDIVCVLYESYRKTVRIV